MKSKSKGQ